MARSAAKGVSAGRSSNKAPREDEPQVLVLGGHPAAYLAGLMLADAGIPACVTDLGTTPLPDRLVTLNPAFFALHADLAPLRQTLEPTVLTSAQFVGESGESTTTPPKPVEKPLAHVISLPALTEQLRALAEQRGIRLTSAKKFVVEDADNGLRLRIGGAPLSPQLLMVVDPLPPEAEGLKQLNLPEEWTNGSLTTIAVAELSNAGAVLADEAVLPMSLDLQSQLGVGWMLRHGERAQLVVQHAPGRSAAREQSVALLKHWCSVLRSQKLLADTCAVETSTIRQQNVPLGGALERECVATRTLLVGPAGGFWSASGEDVYPACWSVRYGVEVAKRAIKAAHPQDALGAFRGRWGATLGDYLRGPQQNLRFLLPLVYRNAVMTERLADALLLGQSIVK